MSFAAWPGWSPVLEDPVGLEYANLAVTCYFCESAWLSGGDLVLANESVEHLFSADLVLGEVDLRWRGVGLSRWQLV